MTDFNDLTERLNRINFSKTINLEDKPFNKQRDIFYNETCVVSSLWNSYPELFNNDIKEVKEFLRKNPESQLYAVKQLLEYEFGFSINIVEKYNANLIEKLIDENKPVLCCLSNNDKGHCVSVFGYDNDNYYVFDSKDTFENKEDLDSKLLSLIIYDKIIKFDRIKNLLKIPKQDIAKIDSVYLVYV